jgi:hypothetical protein
MKYGVYLRICNDCSPFLRKGIASICIVDFMYQRHVMDMPYSLYRMKELLRKICLSIFYYIAHINIQFNLLHKFSNMIFFV